MRNAELDAETVKGQGPEDGVRDAVTVPEESVPGEPEERLMMISESVKAVAAMTGCGISFCVVIPGKDEEERWRLASSRLSSSEWTERESTREILENMCSMLHGFLASLRKMGVEDHAVYDTADMILAEVKKRYRRNDAKTYEEMKANAECGIDWEGECF